MHYVRTTVSFEVELLQRVKAIAGATHRSLSDVVSEAVTIHLQATDEGALVPDEVELPTYGSEGLAPGVHLDDKESMARLLGDEEFPRAHA